MTAMTDDSIPLTPRGVRDEMIAFGVMSAALMIVPLTGIYPFFVMQALCFALLACAFNLLIGYGGLLSFGHAMFLGCRQSLVFSPAPPPPPRSALSPASSPSAARASILR
jgi:hypothetical protein